MSSHQRCAVGSLAAGVVEVAVGAGEVQAAVGRFSLRHGRCAVGACDFSTGTYSADAHTGSGAVDSKVVDVQRIGAGEVQLGLCGAGADFGMKKSVDSKLLATQNHRRFLGMYSRERQAGENQK